MRLALLLLFASLGVHAENKPPVVLVFGDSLSAGHGMRANESWPSLLQARLGERTKVVNASVSGETSGGGLTRLPAALREHKPSVVVLELGGNDGLRGLPMDLLAKNLASMIEMSENAGAKVLLVSMKLPPNFGDDYTKRFHELYATLARRYHLAAPPFLLEGFEDHMDLFQSDQIHPTAAAQPRLVDNIYPSLLPMVK
ncbi:MAG TPA: arylesterase [Myxococcales bacterium]|nr:arylesterase [Myxococcales bacterium]